MSHLNSDSRGIQPHNEERARVESLFPLFLRETASSGDTNETSLIALLQDYYRYMNLQGQVSSLEIVDGGSGFSDSTNVTAWHRPKAFGDSQGDQLTIDFQVGSDSPAGRIIDVQVNNPGFGYKVGDQITINPSGTEASFKVLDIVAGPTSVLSQTINEHDLDSVTDDFIGQLQKEIATIVPNSVSMTKKDLYKKILTFYQHRGSQDSIKNFFKIFFNTDIELFYPKDYIFKTSDAVYNSGDYTPLTGQVDKDKDGKILTDTTSDVAGTEIATLSEFTQPPSETTIRIGTGNAQIGTIDSGLVNAYLESDQSSYDILELDFSEPGSGFRPLASYTYTGTNSSSYQSHASEHTAWYYNPAQNAEGKGFIIFKRANDDKWMIALLNSTTDTYDPTTNTATISTNLLSATGGVNYVTTIGYQEGQFPPTSKTAWASYYDQLAGGSVDEGVLINSDGTGPLDENWFWYSSTGADISPYSGGRQGYYAAQQVEYGKSYVSQDLIIDGADVNGTYPYNTEEQDYRKLTNSDLRIDLLNSNTRWSIANFSTGKSTPETITMSNTFYQWVPSQEFVSISLETINAGQTLTRQSGTAINSFERINHSGFITALNTNAGFSVGQSVRYMSPYYAGGLIWNQSYSTQVASDGTTFVDPGYLSGVTPRISRQFQYSKGSIVGNTNVFNSSGQAGDFAGRNFSLSLTRNPYGGQTYANNIGDQLFNRYTVPFLIDPYGSEWRGVLRTGVASSGGETLLGVSYLDTHPHYDAASVAGEGSVTYQPPAYDVTYSVMRVFLALRGSNTPLWIMYDHWLDLIVAYNTGFNAEFPSGFSDEIGKHYSLSPPSKGWKGTGVYTAGSWAARNDAYIYGVPTSAQEGLEMDAYGIQSTAINTAVPEFTYSTAAELSADNAITLFTDKLTTSTKTYDEIDEVEFEASIDSDKVTVGTVSLDQASTTAQKINASISTDVPTPDFNLTGFQNYHAYNYSPALNVDNFFDSPVSKFSNKQISANHVEYIVDGFHTEENVLNSSPNDPHGDVKRVGKFNGKYIFERQSGHASPNDPHGLVVRYVRPVTDESPNSNPHQSPRFVLEIVNKGNNTGGFRLFDDKNHDSPLQTFEVDTVGDGDLVVGQKLSNSFANTGKIQPRFIGFPAKVGFYDENTLLIEQNPDGSDDKVLLNSNTGTKQTTTGTENLFLKPGKVYYTNKPSSISLRSFNHQDSPNGSVPSGRFPLQGFVQPFTSGGKKFTGMSVADKKVQHYFVYALDSTRVDFFDNVKSSAAPTESVFLEAGKSHTFVSTRSENKEGFIGGDSTGPSVGYIRTSGGNVLVSVASMEKEDSPNSSLDYSPKNQIEESSILTPTDTTSYVRRVSSTSSDSPSQIIGVDESLNFAVDSPHRTSESNQSPNFLRITNFSLRDDSSADMSPATSAKTDLNISVISSSLTIGDHSPSITPDDPSGQFNSPTSHVFLTDFLNDPKQVDINSDLIGVPNKTFSSGGTFNGVTISLAGGGTAVIKDNTFRIIADNSSGHFAGINFNDVLEIGAEYELSYIVDSNNFNSSGRIITQSHANPSSNANTLILADEDTPIGVRIFKTFQADKTRLEFTRGGAGGGNNDCTFSSLQLRKMKGNQEQKLSLNAGIAQKSMADTYVYGAPCTDYCIITPYDNTVTVKYKLQRLIKQNDSPAQLNGYQLAGFTTSDSPNVTINGFYTQSSKDTWVNNSDKRVKIVKKMPGTKYDSPSSDGKIEGLNSPEGGTQWCIIRSKGLQSEISEHQVYFEDPDMISQTNDFADIKWRQSLDKVFGFRGTTTVGQVYLAESASIEDRIKIKFDEFTYKTHSLQASLNSPNGVQVYGQGVDGSPELGGRDPIRVTDSPNDINRVAPTLWKFTGRRPFGLMINTQREIQTLSGFNTNSYNVTEVDNFATTNRQSDAKGRPSDLFKLQDLNYYSEYSYEIRSKLDISEWGDSFQQFAHPAGLKFFGRVQDSPNNSPI